MSSASSMQTVNCLPLWTVYPETGVYGIPQLQWRTQQRCLKACIDDPDCVAVDWDSNTVSCWRDTVRRQRWPRGGITHFDIARPYHTASGASHYFVSTTHCRTISSHLTSGGSSFQHIEGRVPRRACLWLYLQWSV